jgi:uncharacterized integral membrane protein
MNIKYKLFLLVLVAFFAAISFIFMTIYYLFSNIWYYPLSFVIFSLSLSYFIYLQQKSGVREINIGVSSKKGKCESCRQAVNNKIKR